MGEQARGSARDNIVSRWISQPIGFYAVIHMDVSGCVARIGAVPSGLFDAESYTVHRATRYVQDLLKASAQNYHMAEDVLALLPREKLTEVERAIMVEVAALQSLRRPAVWGAAR